MTIASSSTPMATGTPILKKCVDLAREFYADRQLELRRVYVNFNRYGDMQYAHQDAEEGVTALYYANAEWHENWGGETIFYDDGREPVYVVAPKPGRQTSRPSLAWATRCAGDRQRRQPT